MPWILLLLAALFTAPLSAATLPGVPTANTDKNSASEPDVEQKRAAYAALADVLANDSARQELIDQLRKQPPRRRPQHPDADATGGKRRDHGTGERHPDKPGIWRTALITLFPAVAQYHRLTA